MMRVCPSCNSLFGPDQGACPKDGTETEDSVQVLIGRTLGPYTVRSVIGEGGMGVVYVGEHTTIGRRIALKVLRPELSLRDDIVERFTQEARAVNTIGHKNIVNIYDFGRTPFGSFYIVMEYLDGRTIRAILEDEGPQPVQRVRKIVMGVGAALAAAHSKGFIHRDVKPENIIFSEKKGVIKVKLLDFGIAKLLNPEHGPKTRTGAAMGTPQYMSPEQLEEAPFDHRADIYAFGAVTYEMITGFIPYPGKSHGEVRQLQLTQTPTPPSTTRGEGTISRKLDAAILWALSPAIETRCSRIADFLSAFQAGYEAIGQTEAKARPGGKGPGKTQLILMALFATLALAAGAGAIVLLKKNGKSTNTVVDKKDGGQVKPDLAALVDTREKAVALAQERVTAALQSKEASVRARAANFLARRRQSVMRKQLEAALKDTHPNVRRASARALGKMGDRRSIPPLRLALKDSLEYVSWDTAGALARLGDEVGLLRLKLELRKLSNTKKASAIFGRRYILKILGELGHGKSDWKKMIAGKQGMVNASLQRRALGYLAAQGDRQARAKLIQIMSTARWGERIEASIALSQSDGDGALAQKTLREALVQSSGKNRLKAARQLAYFGDEKVAKALVKLLQSSDSETRQESALALSNLPGAMSRSELWKTLEDPSPSVALAGAVALLQPLGD